MQNSLQMHHCTTGQPKKHITKLSSSSTSQNLQSTSTIGGCNSDGPLDALPKQFVESMKTLFDILDDQNTGYVKLIDIETGWQDDGSKGLPHGVIDSLRKVTPANGMLTFERFCAGLKICLLRNQTINPNHYQSSSQQQQQQQQQQQHHQKIHLINKTEKIRRLSSDNIINAVDDNEFTTIINQPIRPPSAPLLDIENPMPSNQWNNTATVRPNNAAILKTKQRTLSLPQLSPDSDLELMPSESIDSIVHKQHRIHHQCPITSSTKVNLYGVTTISPPPPPKPPRTGIIYQNGNVNVNTGIDKAEIRHALQNWQMGVLMNEMDIKEKTKILNNMTSNNGGANYNYISSPIRGTADGGSIEFQSLSSQSGCNLYPKKLNVKRREPRRHTLQNGIDYNLLKRLKQFEGERDILLNGLAAVENAKEWYLQQLSNVQEKMKYLGRMGSHVVQWSDVHQERLDIQRARILEINRHLSTLADIPVHMNLAVRPFQQVISRGNCNNTKSSSTTAPQLVEQRFQSNSQHQQPRHIIDDTTIKSKADRITMFDCDNQQMKRSNRINQIGVKLP